MNELAIRRAAKVPATTAAILHPATIAAAAVIAPYERTYCANIGINGGYRGQDIQQTDLQPLAEALTIAMQPATPREMDAILILIAASWPNAGHKVEREIAELHADLMAEDLGEFPPDAIVAGVRDLRHTSKWMPSIAELREAAHQRSWTRGKLLKIVQARLRGETIAPIPSKSVLNSRL